jgi:pilus assembly protein Flp/PilA
MRSIVKLVKQFKSDEDGAALIEYTVLLGILLVAVVGIITVVSGKVTDIWTGLSTTLAAV